MSEKNIALANQIYEFRGKTAHTGRWVYGGFYMDDAGWYIVTAPNSFERINPVTLGRKYHFEGISFYNGDLVMTAFVHKKVQLPNNPNDLFTETYGSIEDIFYPDIGILMRYRSKLLIAPNVNSCGWDMHDLRSWRYMKVIGNVFDYPLDMEGGNLYVQMNPITFKGTLWTGKQLIGGYYHDSDKKLDYIIQDRELIPVKSARISVDFSLSNGDDSDIEMPEPVYEGDFISVIELDENRQQGQEEIGELVWLDEYGGYGLCSSADDPELLDFDSAIIRHKKQGSLL